MIKIFYTGAPKFLAPQEDKDTSLGGYISSSLVPNDFIGNLFGQLSRLTLQRNQDEYRAIALQNKTGATLTGFKVYIVYPNDGGSPTPLDTNDCVIQLGYQLPSADECGDLKTELLPNLYSRPYTITFQDAVGQGQALSLPDLDNNQYVVLYVKRSLKPSALLPKGEEYLMKVFEGTEVIETQEKISVVLEWN